MSQALASQQASQPAASSRGPAAGGEALRIRRPLPKVGSMACLGFCRSLILAPKASRHTAIQSSRSSKKAPKSIKNRLPNFSGFSHPFLIEFRSQKAPKMKPKCDTYRSQNAFIFRHRFLTDLLPESDGLKPRKHQFSLRKT